MAMAFPNDTPPEPAPARAAAAAEIDSLERGAVLTFAPCPFSLPEGNDRDFLCAQRLRGMRRECISLDPCDNKLHGCLRESIAQTERLSDVLAQSANRAVHWLTGLLPRYADAWELARVAFHPEEEATRKLPPKRRNDLLHIDAAPLRSSYGRRLLRLFVNLHPTDPRVWLTSLPFAELLERYGTEAGLPPLTATPWRGLLQLFQPQRPPVEAYYRDFRRRLREFLMQHDGFQERALKKCWHFPPGVAWLVFTDGISHAELRGRFVLEFAFFIAPQTLALPELAPHILFERACGRVAKSQAA
jgi:hypothetical protein